MAATPAAHTRRGRRAASTFPPCESRGARYSLHHRMRVPPVERRSVPRLGLAVRVGLALTATGIASAGLGRRALSGLGADRAAADGFTCFGLLLVLASLQRPPRISAWIGLALAGG